MSPNELLQDAIDFLRNEGQDHLADAVVIARVKESEIREVLKGIDCRETDDDEGWWETSAGEKFGSERQQVLLDLLDARGLLIRD